jgi:hypothetical protein
MLESEPPLDDQMYRIVRKPPLLRKGGLFRRPVNSAGFDEVPIIALCKLDVHIRIFAATTTRNSGRKIKLLSFRSPKSARCDACRKRCANAKLNCLVPFILPRRSRGQGSAVLAALRAAALLDGVGYAETATPSLDRCAATWGSPSPGNSALTETNMSKIILYTNDENTATGPGDLRFLAR